jgi:hypothetical protein
MHHLGFKPNGLLFNSFHNTACQQLVWLRNWLSEAAVTGFPVQAHRRRVQATQTAGQGHFTTPIST